MACCPKSIVAEIVAKHSKITHVYFVACGGSYAGLYPAKYFMQSNVKDLKIGHYSANEFCHATPKALGETSIVVTQSFSGTTPETARAAQIAREAGAATVAITYDAESPLACNSEWVITYGNKAGQPAGEANDNGHTKGLWLAAEILNAIEGYEHYDAFMKAYEQFNTIVPAAKEKFAPIAKEWAEKYGEEKLIYVMGSGPNYGVTYSWAICLLQEMQWIHSEPIHSGEFFHGPFEVTDTDVPFLVLKNYGKEALENAKQNWIVEYGAEVVRDLVDIDDDAKLAAYVAENNGETRLLDERAAEFAAKFSEHVNVLDCNEFVWDGIDEDLRKYFGVLVVGAVIRTYADALAYHRGHPLSVRRYMWNMAY